MKQSVYIFLSMAISFSSASLFGGAPFNNNIGEGASEQAPRIIQSIKGVIEDAQIISQGDPESDIWTEVTVVFQLKCQQTFENFSYQVQDEEAGRIRILASAIVSQKKVTLEEECSDMIQHQETVKLVGIGKSTEDLDIEFLNIQPLTKNSFDVPAGTEAIIPIDDITVEKVSPLCPKKARCVTDGTVISLSTQMICTDSLAGVAVRATQVDDEIHLDIFGAEYQNQFHNMVKCPEVPVRFSITTVMKFANKPDKVKINLIP